MSLKPEIYPLTGIRAVAALWVVLYHMQDLLIQCYPAWASLIVTIVGHGYLGVDLFFILSGFIIHYNYATRLADFRWAAVGEFLWMRLARIWPVHVFVLGLFVLLLSIQRWRGEMPSQPEFYTAGGLLRNVLLIHGWSIPIVASWNVPAWSISCEWLAYLIFPVLLASRLWRVVVRAPGLIIAGALFGTALVCQLLGAGGGVEYGVIRISGEFLGGAALCHLFRTGVGKDWPWRYFVPIAVPAVPILASCFFPSIGLVGYWCVPLLGGIVLGLAYSQCFVSRFLSTRPMLFGGYISYSLYMLHEICLIVFKRTDGLLGKIAPLADVLGMLMAAAFVFKWVEEPCRRRMRKLFARHSAKPYPVI